MGIKAARRTELVGEAGLRTAYHRHQTAPYRKAAKLQQKSAKANARLVYRQAYATTRTEETCDCPDMAETKTEKAVCQGCP